MKGLLIKEWETSKAIFKWYALIAAVLFVIGAVMGNEGFFLGIGIFVSVSYPAVSIAYDDKDKWFKFALASGCSPRKLAWSKFVIPVSACFVLSCLSAVAMTFIQDKDLPWEEIPIMFAIMLVMLSVMIPLYIKFGAEHGRVVVVIIMLVAMIGADAFFGSFTNPESIGSSAAGIALSWLSPIAGAAVVAGSAELTARIIKSKEY